MNKKTMLSFFAMIAVLIQTSLAFGESTNQPSSVAKELPGYLNNNMFSYPEQDYLVFMDSENTSLFHIVDSDLNLVKNVSLPKEPESLYLYGYSNGYKTEQYMAQTLFNEDDLFECLFAKWENGEISSYEVRNENGDLICKYDLPREFQVDRKYILLYDGNRYFVVEGRENNHVSKNLFFKIDPKGSKVSYLREMPNNMSVAPTLCNTSMPITVTLDNPKDYVNLQLVSESGQIVRQINVEGKQQIQIPTANLTKGLYIVCAVTKTNTVSEYSKVIVQ